MAFDTADNQNSSYTVPVIIVDEPPVEGENHHISYKLTGEQIKKIEEMAEVGQRVFLAARKANSSSPEDIYETGTMGFPETFLPLGQSSSESPFILRLSSECRAEVTAVSKGGKVGEMQVTARPLEMDVTETPVASIKAKVALEKFGVLKRKAETLVNWGVVTGRASSETPVIEGIPLAKIVHMLKRDIGKLYKPDNALMQKVIEQNDMSDCFDALIDVMKEMEQRVDLETKIRNDARAEANKAYNVQDLLVMQKQISSRLKELGHQDDDEEDEIKVLEDQIESADMRADIRKKFNTELKKLGKMQPSSPEYSKIFDYLKFMAEMPWNKASTINHDIARAEEILDEDHYGLEKVKEEVIEHLAVLASPDATGKGKRLCLVGPPGVGKTSIGKSVAKSMGREYVRLSVGGISDEAEIRGFNRTYVGASPGRIAKAIKEAGVSNPLMMLDEIDKTNKNGNKHQGAVDAAMLELLDPEQNISFRDRYMDVDLDLSKVLFIATANYPEDIPAALKDRLEIVNLDGYLDEQKFQIARRYLVPKQMKSAGLNADKFSVSDDALREIINYHTREAGVRILEQRIAKLCSKTQAMIKKGVCEKVAVSPENLSDFLGARRYSNELPRKTPTVGVGTGLAYTEAGGDILSIETVKFPGSGALTATGNLHKVIEESTRVAMGVVKSRAVVLGIDPKVFRENDVHIHIPAGATPKDGPSAGGIITVALASLFTGQKIRNDLAMTGEINLSGEITEIGGLAQKFQAAARAGIKTVLIPAENLKDLAGIPKDVRDKLEIIPVETIDDVFRHVFIKAAETQEKAVSSNVVPLPVARPAAAAVQLNLMSANKPN